MDTGALFLQSFTLQYFAAALWLLISIGAFCISRVAGSRFRKALFLVLGLNSVLWGYLFFGILGARLALIGSPLIIQAMLILITLLALQLDTPTRDRRRLLALYIVHAALGFLLITLALSSIFAIVPFGALLPNWVLNLLQAYPLLALVLLIGFAYVAYFSLLSTRSAARRVGIALLSILLIGGTFTTMLGMLITLTYPS